MSETDHSDQGFSCTSSEDDVESFSSSEEVSTGIMGEIVAYQDELWRTPMRVTATDKKRNDEDEDGLSSATLSRRFEKTEPANTQWTKQIQLRMPSGKLWKVALHPSPRLMCSTGRELLSLNPFSHHLVLLRDLRQTRIRQIYVDSTVDDGCYVCTNSSLQALCKYFMTNPLCEFCGEDYTWASATFSSQGHFCKLEFPCVCNDPVTWLSSGVLRHPAKYYANVRMVHAFTYTGLTETQYRGFTEAAGIGCVMDKTIDTSGGWTLVVSISSQNNDHLQSAPNSCLNSLAFVPLTEQDQGRKLSDSDIHELPRTEGKY
ncbi:hypothetical protein AWC38_SpisGene20154 [Stylophora pistillata]|uniref:Uncharacterized protein n=1 Tax=Stylophora pistillata TaxID=50429 RepID=A0A2B4RDA5_STYPI|nr:hypothetical protein AWC38_SpisGene20154 [Stylophora pistillata]